MLAQAREVLLGYAAAHGYFPVPCNVTTNGSVPAATIEPCRPGLIRHWHRGYYGGFPASRSSSDSPVDTQGLPSTGGVDVTANRIRYAIASQTSGGITLRCTREAAAWFCRHDIQSGPGRVFFTSAISGTGVTASDCGTSTHKITSAAVAVIWSLGRNAATGGGTSVHESKNLDGDRVFVSRPRSNVAGSEFDDILTWIHGHRDSSVVRLRQASSNPVG